MVIRKTWLIARKEIISSFRQRNLLLVMFLTPLVLVTIMGLAFSSIASDDASAVFADIPIAVVNLDTGVTPTAQLPPTWTATLAELPLDSAGGQRFRLGDQLAAILLAQPITTTAGSGESFAGVCPFAAPTAAESPVTFASLDALFATTPLTDPAQAMNGVADGRYAAAVIIAAEFSRAFIPTFSASGAPTYTTTSAVQVIANEGTPIAASIVRAVVEGIVGQFEQTSISFSALSGVGTELLDPASALHAPWLLDAITAADVTAWQPLACLFQPDVHSLQLAQQPLDPVQERDPFSALMVILGGSQAVFFALFTGVFGINSIYEDRIQGTLQRLIVTPTPRSAILFGRLLGNLGLVAAQLLLLLLAFTAIASLVERELLFIWGDYPLALLLTVLGLSLFTTSFGVLIVGLARSSEQVQLIGPILSLILGAFGGTFGPWIPPQMARFAPTWWGVDALGKLAANDPTIGLNLMVLFGVGLLFAAAGTVLFRRRMAL